MDGGPTVSGRSCDAANSAAAAATGPTGVDPGTSAHRSGRHGEPGEAGAQFGEVVAVEVQAFWPGSLYVAVADSRTIVRVPLRTSGDAGTPGIVAQANVLRTAGGIAFDVHGNLYITVNTNRLVRLAPDGALTELAAKNNGLAYPTMPAFGTTPATRTTLYITNGALDNGTPNIVAFNAGVRGLPLP